MNIAYLLNTYPQPSHSFIRRELRALEAQGHEVMRLAMRAPDVPLVEELDIAEAARTEYVLAAGAPALATATIKMLAAEPARWTQALRLAWRCGRRSDAGILRHLIYVAEACHVVRRCRAARISHVHAHFGTNAACVAMLAQVLGGPAYSFTVHGPEEFDSPRALSLQDKISRAAFTVAISQFGRSQLCRWADPSDWPRLKVVHCGIEPARFEQGTSLTEGQRRIVSIGRFVEQKGQLALIEALAGMPESDLHLTLIGDGEMRGALDALIARHGLGARVTLTGWVDENRIRAELNAAHALVMPSFAEGLPMVVMEAMASARPVIATHIAGIPELVRHGETGWLVPAGDVAALGAALQALVETPLPVLSAMGQAGRDRVLQRHDAASEAARLSEFIAAA